MNILRVCMYTTCLPGTCGNQKRVVGVPGTGVTGSCDPPRGWRALNLGHLQKQSVLTTTEPPLQLHSCLFLNEYFRVSFQVGLCMCKGRPPIWRQPLRRLCFRITEGQALSEDYVTRMVTVLSPACAQSQPRPLSCEEKVLGCASCCGMKLIL